MNSFNLVSTDFKIEDFIRVKTTLLNQTMARDNNKEFPFGIVPMLPLCNAWLTDIDAYLSTVECVNKFGE